MPCMPVATLEGGETGVATSSGMAAILCAILTFVGAGEHVLCSDEIYGATAFLLETELIRLGIDCSFVPFHSSESIEEVKDIIADLESGLGML
ncbi:PLP-dependent transferase [Aneurinibacillus migulanus]|uniref:PLP-dependent transferase n=1 Tax=Aneurinibacillus migulanus TaxID=47500 RepID=UPI002E1E1137|nr:PLP-dependent transferase [Aneurinibacillus migulanus]MED4728242.1 PLP-dependent transferase [Aneurinibacillus migulanus]